MLGSVAVSMLGSVAVLVSVVIFSFERGTFHESTVKLSNHR